MKTENTETQAPPQLWLNAVEHQIQRDGKGQIKEIKFKLAPREELLFTLQQHIATAPPGGDQLREALEVINDCVDSVKFTITGEVIKYECVIKDTADGSQEKIIKRINKVLNYSAVKEIIKKINHPRSKKKIKGHLAPDNFRAGQHLMKQIFNPPKNKPTLFNQDQAEEIIKTTGQKKVNDITEYGMVLNPLQMRVFEGILTGFSNTNYEGHYLIDTFKGGLEDVYEVTGGSAKKLLNEVYANIQKIPVLKITQAELLRLCGYDDGARSRWADKNEVLAAFEYLTSNQFLFNWSRLKKDEKGKPVKNKAGDYELEDVMEVGSIFRVRIVRDKESGIFKYYEILPSAVVLDQVKNTYGGSYFLTIPCRWQDEVKAITGKKPKHYTTLLLLWLRLEYEKIRSHNAKGHTKPRDYDIKISWEDLAEVLKMPPSLYKRNRSRAVKMIQGAYSDALKIGYLREVKTEGAVDVLVLNQDYYPTPGEVIDRKSSIEKLQK